MELTRAVDYALAREIAHVFHSFGGGRGSRDGEKPLLNRMAVNQVLIDEGQAAYFGALYSDSRDRYPLIIHPAYAKEEVRIPEFKREVARMYLDSAFDLLS